MLAGPDPSRFVQVAVPALGSYVTENTCPGVAGVQCAIARIRDPGVIRVRGIDSDTADEPARAVRSERIEPREVTLPAVVSSAFFEMKTRPVVVAAHNVAVSEPAARDRRHVPASAACSTVVCRSAVSSSRQQAQSPRSHRKPDSLPKS